MRVIGLTGGIGTGKSAVAAILASLGAAVVDADAVGHAAYEPGSEGFERVVALFGQDVVGPDGRIDRPALGELVFASPAALEQLNAALHPLMKQMMAERLVELRRGGQAVAVVDAALLYQAGWDELAEQVWVVTAPEDVALERLEGRGIPPEAARRRMAAQSDVRQYVARADAVIANSGSLDALRQRVETLWNERIPSGGGEGG
ncbi:MAG: dephospho-CoA kinase [Chloroflexota bacterium]